MGTEVSFRVVVNTWALLGCLSSPDERMFHPVEACSSCYTASVLPESQAQVSWWEGGLKGLEGYSCYMLVSKFLLTSSWTKNIVIKSESWWYISPIPLLPNCYPFLKPRGRHRYLILISLHCHCFWWWQIPITLWELYSLCSGFMLEFSCRLWRKGLWCSTSWCLSFINKCITNLGIFLEQLQQKGNHCHDLEELCFFNLRL